MAKPKSGSKPSAATANACCDILGNHPTPPKDLGGLFDHVDGKTESGVAHRALSVIATKSTELTSMLQAAVLKHHSSADQINRVKQVEDAILRLGLKIKPSLIGRLPKNPTTQKGNLAEILLAEYVAQTADLELPVYRLRYNPNVDQSMKGDDVLAFDLDSNPVRIIVGEAKFRATSSAQVVREIAENLLASYSGVIPISLQFVADRLFELGHPDQGRRLLETAVAIAKGQARLDYIGLLMSDANAAARVTKHTPSATHRLVMLSLSVDDPTEIVTKSYP